MSYSASAHVTYHNRYHLVWVTKYRYKVLTKPMRLRIREITRQVCAQLGVTIIKGVLSGGRRAAARRQGLRRRRKRHYVGTSSVCTLKSTRVHGPKVVAIATSVASRPRATRIRPMRGVLLRASKLYHRPSR